MNIFTGLKWFYNKLFEKFYKKTQENIQSWWGKKENPHEKLFYFLFSLILIYFIWFLLFYQPMIKKEKELNQKILQLAESAAAFQKKTNVLLETVKDSSFSERTALQKKLTEKLALLQKQVDNLKPAFIQKDQISKLTNDIINQKNNRIILVSLQNFPAVQWMPNGVDKNDLAKIMIRDIYEYNLKIEFQSDYFNTLDYLIRLEKLPWPIYWDSIEYKVLSYPKADVILKMHVLSQDKDD